MTVKCRDAKGRPTSLAVNVDGADGITVEVYDHAELQTVAIVYIDTNNARSLQHGVKACRMGAEARAVAK